MRLPVLGPVLLCCCSGAAAHVQLDEIQEVLAPPREVQEELVHSNEWWQHGNGWWEKVALPSAVVSSHFMGENVVLQRREPAAVWGTGEPGVRVTLSLDGVSVAETAVSDVGSHGSRGRWIAYLPPHEASWGNKLVISSVGMDDIVVRVNFGEVVLCSGQSNAEMPVMGHLPGYHATNATEEIAGAGHYTGRISLMSAKTMVGRTIPEWNGTTCGSVPQKPHLLDHCVANPMWQQVSPGENGTLSGFSALCWHTGKAMYHELGARVAVGLISAALPSTTIELWLPPGAVNDTAEEACGMDEPPCDTGANHNLRDSLFYEYLVHPHTPYTIGSVLWDQGEADEHCRASDDLPYNLNHTDRYPCLQRSLVNSWRRAFNSTFGFVAVQLPSFVPETGCVAEDGSLHPVCVPGIFNMRLAQDSLGDVQRAESAPTYDLSCPSGSPDSPYGIGYPPYTRSDGTKHYDFTSTCPIGSIHPPFKGAIAARTAKQLLRLREHNVPYPKAMYPRAYSATCAAATGDETYRFPGNMPSGKSLVFITVRFMGGDGKLKMWGTQYCDTCCSDVGDFDISTTGGHGPYVNASAVATVAEDGSSVMIPLVIPSGQTPTHVRYTANQPFAQCAVLDEKGWPAHPFKMAVEGNCASQSLRDRFASQLNPLAAP
jgi:hypothetical protein